MTNSKFDLSSANINNLFNEGKCITYVPFVATDAWVYTQDKKREFEKQTGMKAVIKSKTAIMPQISFTKGFHFFSNGVLITETLSEKKIHNIVRAIKLNGFEVKKIYKPQNTAECILLDMFLDNISKEAEKRYRYQDDLLIEPMPDVKTFVEDLFKNNNECLSASKNEMLNPMHRDYMAVFANGRVIVSKEKTDNKNIFGTLEHINFKNDNDDYVFLSYEYVPHCYLEAIYEKAKEYSWYISKEEIQAAFPQKNITKEETDKMNFYIDTLLQNRTCISITTPIGGGEIATSPDNQKYVLFSDGKLVYGRKNVPTPFLKRCFPDLKIEEEKVPEYYIDNIYKRLLSVQKSANEIFSEMLKQKAKKLKKILNIPHYEALDVVAKISGLSKWEQVGQLTEQESRRGIYLEQEKKKYAKDKTYEELIKQEYQRFIKNGN